MPVPLSRWLPLVVLLVAALWLRTSDLARRPMHSDEANQAVKLGELIEHGKYALDPRDHHGPTLYYAALPIAWLRGQHTLAALNETTVRLVPAIAGTLGVLLLAGLARPLGRWPALAAAAFFAVSPPAVYYSRDFIQETLLLTFVLGAFAGGQRWWKSGHAGWAALAGASAGLALATKETAPLFFAAAGVALLVVRPPRPASTRVARDFGMAVVAALLVAALLFSSFGTHWAGLRDALEAYGFGARRAASGAGHEKPWWYYAALFGIERRDGLVWGQLGFSALATCGAALALLQLRRGGSRPVGDARGSIGRVPTPASRATSASVPVCQARAPGPASAAPSRGDGDALAPTAAAPAPPAPAPAREAEERHTLYDIVPGTGGGGAGAKDEDTGAPRRFGWDAPAAARLSLAALVYTAIVAAALSLVPYKTPWNMIHLVPGLCVLAAGALALVPRAPLGVLLAALVLFTQASQTRLAAFVRPADERNPYAYVQSSPDVLKVRALVEAALRRMPRAPVRVIGDEYWPIPWYLRGLDRIGYWTTAPDDCDGALVIASGSQIDVVRARLHGRYRESYLGLRPGVLCVVFTPEP